MQRYICIIFIASLALTHSACLRGPGLFKQSGQQDSTLLVAMQAAENADGIVTAFYNPNLYATQTVTASLMSEIAGSSINFPPGTLSMSTNISLEPGSSFVGAMTAADLGLTSLQASSAALAISSSASVDASSPFTVNLSMSSLGLRLDEAQGKGSIAIVYYIDRAEDGKKLLGIIPPSEVTRNGNILSFRTKYFGVYQAAYISEDVKEVKEIEAPRPVLTKAQEKQLPPVTWELGTPTLSGNVARFPFAISGLGDIKECSFAVYESTSSAPIHIAAPRNASLFSNKYGAFTLTRTGSYQLFARFECVDVSGRFNRSPFSKALSVHVPQTGAGGTNPGSGGGGNSSSISVPPITNLTAIPYSSIAVHLQWPHPSADINYYRVSWSTDSHHNDCQQGARMDLMRSDDAMQFVAIRGVLNAFTTYHFSVCASRDQSIWSSSTNIAAATLTRSDDICSTGTLDDDCIVTINHPFSATKVISGTGDLTIQNGGTLSMSYISDHLIIDMLGDVDVQSGGIIEGNIYDLTAQNITVAGTIHANGFGHAGGTIGGVPLASQGGNYPGGGGGNGGAGGNSGTGGSGGSATMPPPTDGSLSKGGGGGGDGGTNAGGAGGGVIDIRANGTLTISTSNAIQVNGKSPPGGAETGGGAGGHIVLKATTISGSGSVTAHGGSGSGIAAGPGGGGGGGGFIFVHGDTSGATLSCYAFGGSGAGDTPSGAPGQPGLVSGC